MDVNLVEVLKDIHDLLFPKAELDAYEQALYHFVFRKTKIEGIDDLTLTLPEIASALNMSVPKARDLIRGMNEKQVIKSEQTRKGYRVNLLLPSDLGLRREILSDKKIEIESLDFFNDKRYSKLIIIREGHKCFYCSKEISDSNVELDHVVSQSQGGSNSYRNIVAACHICNTKKIGNKAEDFIRTIYRKNLLTIDEFESVSDKLSSLVEGKIRPNIPMEENG